MRFDDLALEYAQASNEASGMSVWQYLDTLALAQFRAGAVREAIATEERALGVVEAPEQLAAARRTRGVVEAPQQLVPVHGSERTTRGGR